MFIIYLIGLSLKRLLHDCFAGESNAAIGVFLLALNPNNYSSFHISALFR